MTTPTPIATFEDILAAMENNPQLQVAMRQHILDQEFLQLPAIVRQLQQTVDRLGQVVQEYVAATNARLERLEQDVSELKAGQARLESNVNRLDDKVNLLDDKVNVLDGKVNVLDDKVNVLDDKVNVLDDKVNRLDGNMNRLDGNMNRLDGNMNRLIGSDYERKAARRASRLAQQRLSMSEMRVIYAITTPDNSELPGLLDRAVAAGRIDVEEADELENADLILAGSDLYLVAETSVTLDENDVQRARNRADLLEKATTASTRAAVIGAHALDTAVQHADTNDVAIIILPE